MCGPRWKRSQSKPAPSSFNASAVRACVVNQIWWLRVGTNFLAKLWDSFFLLNGFLFARNVHFFHENLMFCWKRTLTPENGNLSVNWKFSQHPSFPFFSFNHFPSTHASCLPRHDLIPADPPNDALQWLSHRAESFSNFPMPLLMFVGCLESFPCPYNPKESNQPRDKAELFFPPLFFQYRIHFPSEYPPLTRLNGIAEKLKKKQSYWNRNNLG